MLTGRISPLPAEESHPETQSTELGPSQAFESPGTCVFINAYIHMHVSVYMVSSRTSDWDFDGGEKKGLCELGCMNIECESSSDPRERKGRGEGQGRWGRHAENCGVTRSLLEKADTNTDKSLGG